MNPLLVIFGSVATTVVTLLGGIAAWRTAGATKNKTVADTYGEAIDRLREDAEEDRERAKQERKEDRDEIAALKSASTEHAAHSARQDKAIFELQQDVTIRTDHAIVVHDWLDAGQPDPPGRPARPPWANRTQH